MEMQRIDASSPTELQRWAEQLAVPVATLQAAIDAVGTDVDKVKGYLAAAGGTAAAATDG